MSDKNYSRITIKVHDSWDFRNIVKQAADSTGESVNAFMIRAIRDKVKECGIEFPVTVLAEDNTSSQDKD